ncbi:MAG: DUF2065 domain-containing protein [Kiloniellales bacterium]
MSDLLTALALVFVIEGCILALFPGAPAALYERLAQLPPETLRIAGLVAVALGVLAVWFLRA